MSEVKVEGFAVETLIPFNGDYLRHPKRHGGHYITLAEFTAMTLIEQGIILNANRPVSEETRKKISEATKGKKKPTQTEEHKKKNAEANKGRKHPPRSEEARKKISEARKGKPAHNKGKPSPSKGTKRGPMSEETIRKRQETRRLNREKKLAEKMEKL